MKQSTNWIKLLARAGYASRGSVYLIIGCFSVLAAFGAGDTKDTKGALMVLLEQPSGDVMLAIMIVGLVGYTLWRLVQSILDTDDHGWSAKGLLVRSGLLASAFTYATLALFSASLLGFLPGSDGGGFGGFATTLSGLIGSRYTSLALAVIFLGVACAHFWKAALRKYDSHFEASDRQMQFIHPIAILGLAARGLVFVLISALLFYRFLNADDQSDSPPNVKDALQFVQDLPFGQGLLLVMGGGLVLFSLYSITEAIWRRINLEDASLSDQG